MRSFALAARASTPWAVVFGAATSIRVSIDPNGNLTGDGTKTYQWDAEDRLVAVLQGSTTLASFVYDGEGRRNQKTAGGVTHTYIYGVRNAIEERLSSGQTIDYVQGPGVDRPLAQRDQANAVSYYLADHLGSIAQVTNSSGAATLTREYDPWGNLLQGSSASGYAFTGREWDPETGLHYYRARYYDSARGRFISEDSVTREDLRKALFTYAGNRVTVATDPTGHYTLAASAQPYALEIEAAMVLLRLKVEAQPRQCCVDWFRKGRVNLLQLTLRGPAPEIRVEDPQGTEQGYTFAPFDFVVLERPLLRDMDIQGGNKDMCHVSSVILHEFGHIAGKDTRPGFRKACTYECLNPGTNEDQ